MIEELSIHAFINKYELKNEQGTPIDFYNHFFLFDIYKDFSKKLAVLKAAQIGMTTCEIIKSLWAVKNKGIDSVYILPTDSDVNSMVGSKVNRIIAQNPILQEWTKDKDSITQKQIGSNYIHYRGSWSEKAAIMVTSDWNMYDEVDACKQDVVEQYSTRLQHSKLKWEHYFSHPSSVGTGVDKYWVKSDQKHWFITCKSCGEEQFMEWPKSFDMDNEKYICKFCKKELEDEDRRVGRWVAKYKDREFSGYWIPLFIAPWVSAKDIINYYKDKSEEYFYNKVLGLPYVGGGNKLTKAHLMQNLTGEEIITPGDNERIVIGVDTGNNVHYVVGCEQGIFHYDYFSKGELNSQIDKYQELEHLMKRWPRAIMVIDQGGDITGSRALRQKYPGRVFLCTFGTDRKTKELIRWGKNDEDGAVVADRNRCIQMTVDEFTDNRIPIQGKEDDWYDYYLHWNALTRIKEFDQKTMEIKRRLWVRNSDDHWCIGAGVLITTDKGEIPIQKVHVGDKVLTRKGYKRVLHSGTSGKNVIIKGLVDSRGSILWATGNHKIYIIDKGWTTVDNILVGDKLQVCKQKSIQLNSTETNTSDTPTTKQGTDFTILQHITTNIRVSCAFIKKYGSSIMEIFQKTILFIIKTAIHLIIQLKILSVFLGQNITASTSRKDGKTQNIKKDNLKLLKKDSKTQLKKKKIEYNCLKLEINKTILISGLKKLKNITVNFLSSFYSKSQRSLSVLDVVLKPLLYLQEVVSSAQKRVEIVTVLECPIKEKRVFNLSVEDQTEYYANGVLVSNSMATVYWRIGIDRFGSNDNKIIGEKVEVEEAPVVYVGGTMDAKFALGAYKKKPKHDWRTR